MIYVDFFRMLSVIRAEGVEALDVINLFRLDVLHEQREHRKARGGDKKAGVLL